MLLKPLGIRETVKNKIAIDFSNYFDSLYHKRTEGGGHCAMALPSDPTTKKCINSFRQCILSVLRSVYQNV